MSAIVKITKEEAKRRLSNVAQEYTFFCHDGRMLYSLAELQDALANMSDDVFAYHSSEGKSDFSNWVRDIIRDETLARQLYQANTRTKARKVVEQRIVLLSGKI